MQSSGQTGTKMTRDWKQWEGQTVNGNFPLRQYLGGSEQSAVFLTERRGQEPQRAAIKLIAANPATVEVQLARWEAAAKLSHPHLLRLFETGSCQLDKVVFLYVVMEYAEDNLAQILPHRALTPEEVRDLLEPALDALTYVHGKSLVHSRLKPSNVMAAGDQLKLSSDSLLRSGDPAGRLGSPTRYDAPELAKGNIMPASDAWSLGMTVMEALTQRLPAVEGITEPLPETVPAPFMGIAHCCLRRDPQRRCTVADIVTRLQAAGPAPQKASTVRIPASSKKSQYVFTVAAAALILLAVVIGPKLINRHSDSKGVNSVSSQPPVLSAPIASSSAPNASPKPESAPATPVAKPPATRPSHEAQTSRASASSAAPAPTASAPSATVSEQGKVLQQVEPAVSKSARNTVTGTLKVRIKVSVDASGNVENATFVSPGPSKYFARQAMEAAQQWKFAPAQMNGQAVPSAWVLHFGFRKSGTEVEPEPVKP
jgi:eukaryotic-like serine/threonine-protein kinase